MCLVAFISVISFSFQRFLSIELRQKKMAEEHVRFELLVFYTTILCTSSRQACIVTSDVHSDIRRAL